MKIVRPYIFIAIVGLLAFAPITLMLKAVKNDIIAIEYPINYFISECIHNGEIPYWFNTWGMGFPLLSNLTWGIFSTPQILFCSLFHYNIYVLHIEFLFFVLVAGWGMFYLLQRHFVLDKSIAQLFAISYMLSGFIVGSTQWMLYVTAAAMLPIIVNCLLSILLKPSFGKALQFAIVYYIMFTSTYVAFSIITTYSLIAFLLMWFGRLYFMKEIKSKTVKYLAISALLTFLLCLPCLYYTVELLKYIDRGSPLTSRQDFFNSNYLHPSALSSMLLPLSSARMTFPNTEGTMLNTYLGLFALLLLPLSVSEAFSKKNKPAIVAFFFAILFLLLSFGNIAYLRNVFNVLPGFSYFRNHAIFRLYFIFLLILFIAQVNKCSSLTELFNFRQNRSTMIPYFTLLTFILLLTFLFLLSITKKNSFSYVSLFDFVKKINLNQTIVINSFIQLFTLIAVLVSVRIKKIRAVYFILSFELVINTLICTPFFSVSNYSIAEVNNILKSTPGFPLQNSTLSESPATYTDQKTNTWQNINIFHKEVSLNQSYRGPLTIKNNYYFVADSLEKKDIADNYLVFMAKASDSTKANKVILNIQRPTHIRVTSFSSQPASLTVMQNRYPGWSAFCNNEPVKLDDVQRNGISVEVPSGKNIVDFKYSRVSAFIFALSIHLLIICFLLWKVSKLIKIFISS